MELEDEEEKFVVVLDEIMFEDGLIDMVGFVVKFFLDFDKLD